jgi:tetratricopeptide (TPR) repeat protein
MDQSMQFLTQARELTAAGRHADAMALLAENSTSVPDTAEVRLARASVLFNWGRFREARDEYLGARANAGIDTFAEFRLGWASLFCGDAAGAEACVRAAIAMDSEAETSLRESAKLLLNLGLRDEAEPRIRSILDRSPGDAEFLWLLGVCRMGQRDPGSAETHFRSAIAHGADRAIVWKDLGAALEAQGRLKEAIEASANAVRLDSANGEDSGSFVNLAIQLADDGRSAEAIALFEHMLPARPNPYGHFAYGQALLRAGRLHEGWRHHEFRQVCGQGMSLHQPLGRPVWSGQNLEGKTILLWAEQGLGDTIQFVRYAALLKACGATVLLRVPAELESFASTVPGVDRVLERGPTRVEFDYYLNTMSLPFAFDTDLTDVPAENPYLFADPEAASRWARRISESGDFKIGIVWAGNPDHKRDAYRSMPLATLAALAGISGVRFYSLQKGSREEEALSPPEGFYLENLGPHLGDLRDTAAAIGQLDLLISVDTALAHLAGALGKPVWLMLPTASDWRWMEGRQDTPWYPTMRIFRQQRQGDWGDVIDRIGRDLRSIVAGDRTRLEGARLPHLDIADDLPAKPAKTSSPTTIRDEFSALADTRAGMLQYLPNEPGVGDALRWYGEWLQPQIDLLTKIAQPSDTVLEIEAGVGAHAIPLAAHVGAAGHLILYESRFRERQVLQHNLAAHRANNATLMRAKASGSGSAATLESMTGERKESGLPIAPSETLDDLRLSRLNLVKASVHVDAGDMLAGATQTMWRLRPTLFLDVMDETKFTSLVSQVRDFGYRCWRVDTAWFNPHNFNRRDDDIFGGLRALTLVAVPEENAMDLAPLGGTEV